MQSCNGTSVTPNMLLVLIMNSMCQSESASTNEARGPVMAVVRKHGPNDIHATSGEHGAVCSWVVLASVVTVSRSCSHFIMLVSVYMKQQHTQVQISLSHRRCCLPT
jgi:hypothetical protein